LRKKRGKYRFRWRSKGPRPGGDKKLQGLLDLTEYLGTLLDNPGLDYQQVQRIIKCERDSPRSQIVFEPQPSPRARLDARINSVFPAIPLGGDIRHGFAAMAAFTRYSERWCRTAVSSGFIEAWWVGGVPYWDANPVREFVIWYADRSKTPATSK
jgi:hypothetical protein